MPTPKSQTDQPLFDDVLWSRPISRQAAPSFTVLGGHSQQFNSLQFTYRAIAQTGKGRAMVLAPSTLKKHLEQLPEAVILEANNSGALAKINLDKILDYAESSDCLVLAGDFSQNSETVSLLEQILENLDTPVAIGDEATQLMAPLPQTLLKHPNRLIFGTNKTFRKLGDHLDITDRLKPSLGIRNQQKLLSKIAQKQNQNTHTKTSNSPVRTSPEGFERRGKPGNDNTSNRASSGNSALVLLEENCLVYKNEALVTPLSSLVDFNWRAVATGLFSLFWRYSPQDEQGIATAAFILREAAKNSETPSGLLEQIQEVLSKY